MITDEVSNMIILAAEPNPEHTRDVHLEPANNGI
jgi:hypothetical protein